MILKILTSLNRVLKKLLGIICAVAMGILVLDVLWGVITRYLTGGQASFTEELARMERHTPEGHMRLPKKPIWAWISYRPALLQQRPSFAR